MIEQAIATQGWRRRILSWNCAVLLGRNTAVSSGVFLIGLALLWVLVEYEGVDKLIATAASFLVANSIHYVLGRAWIYRGTERGALPGYGLFLLNALVGLGITLAFFGALIRFTPIHYLAARVIVSIFAGLVMFLLNAVVNFRRL